MTSPLSRIVVATDLSPRSDRAVERAFQLGGVLGLPVTALMVLDDALPDALLSPLHEKAQGQLEAVCARVAQGVEYRVSVQPGDPTEDLVAAVDPAKETLLVMGPHRPRPFLDRLRETTMQRVARRTAAPVLLVKEPVTGDYQALLSLIDFQDPATHAMRLGATLAPAAPITPAHAVFVPYSGVMEATGAVQMDLQQTMMEDAQSLERAWRAAQEEMGARLEPSRIELAAPADMIAKTTKARGYDLLTVGAHGKVGAGRDLLGSVATDLMRNPPCDVLIGR